MEDKILNKIKKLLRHSESAKQLDSIEEAQTFLKKALSLATQHNLNIDSIDLEHNEDSIISSGKGSVNYGQVKSDGTWDRELIIVLARHNFCDYVFNSYSKTGSLIGQSSNIEVVQYLIEVAKRLIKQASNKAYNAKRKSIIEQTRVYAKSKTHAIEVLNGLSLLSDKYRGVFQQDNIKQIRFDPTSTNPYCFRIINPEKAKLIAYRKVWIRSFLSGAVEGLRSKLQQQRVEEKQHYGQKMNDLIVVHDHALEAYFKKHLPRLKSVKTNIQISEYEAAKQGYRVGKDIELSQGLTQGMQKQVIKKLNK